VARSILMGSYGSFVFSDHSLYPVLKNANDEELGLLVETLCTKNSCGLKPATRDVPAIVNELQLMGGNSIANVARGHGVLYSEIVGDVADQVGVKLDDDLRIAEKEWRILEHLVERAEEKMSEQERQAFYEEVRKQSGVQDFRSVKDLLLHQAVYNAVRLVVIRIVVGKLLVKLGVRSAARIAGGRLVTILGGPIGVVLGTIWAVIDIAGPAYSVTVPCVLLVAMIRSRQDAERVAKTIGVQD